jgi:hypothetical protein
MTGLNIYSIGVVAVDKVADNLYVEVFPLEILPTVADDLSKQIEESASTEDIYGMVNEVKITKGYTIRCKWLPISNDDRLTPPDVRKGERVVIYRTYNTDIFFWDIIGSSKQHRGLEHIVWQFSNKKEFNVLPTPESAYTFTLSTRDKLIELKTVETDNEKTSYTLTLNTGEGISEFIDTHGNNFKLDSVNDVFESNIVKDVTIKIGNDTTMEIGNDYGIAIKNNSTTTIDNDESVSVKNNSSTEIGKTLNYKIGEDSTIDVGKELKVKIGSGATYEVGDALNISVKGDETIELAGALGYKLKTMKFENTTGEFVGLVIDTLKAIIQGMGIGNMGAPVAFDPATIAMVNQLISRLETFKG